MDALQSSTLINTELSQIGMYKKDVLDQKDAAKIFNGIVTCIVDELVDEVKFSVVSRLDPSKILSELSWQYDLLDRKNIHRSGPSLQNILVKLQRIPAGTAQLIHEVAWSEHFFALEKSSQDQIYRSVYWEKKPHTPAKRKSSAEDELDDLASLDLQAIDLDLLRIEKDTGLIDPDKRKSISESARKCIIAGYCRGISVRLLDRHNIPVVDWSFELTPDHLIMRKGSNHTQVLAYVKKSEDLLQISVLPLTTPRFDKLLAKDRYEVMKDTYWASSFKKKGLFG